MHLLRYRVLAVKDHSFALCALNLHQPRLVNYPELFWTIHKKMAMFFIFLFLVIEKFLLLLFFFINLDLVLDKKVLLG
jgi:hypothetical protein